MDALREDLLRQVRQVERERRRRERPTARAFLVGLTLGLLVGVAAAHIGDYVARAPSCGVRRTPPPSARRASSPAGCGGTALTAFERDEAR